MKKEEIKELVVILIQAVLCNGLIVAVLMWGMRN